MRDERTNVLVASALSGPPAFAAAAGHYDLQKDLFITQSLGEPQGDGSSMYRVTVTNQCAGDERTGKPCVISRIRLQCGNFRSVIPVDPKVLRVVVLGVCLLNAATTSRRTATSPSSTPATCEKTSMSSPPCAASDVDFAFVLLNWRVYVIFRV
ncbi:uncharacterized protein LOC125524261 [Triticum urartu]|uniref:uncharacterized protein LOC125524253 n=1 Tax=Triticum urartu TaxID=4572 RepID=UPI0020440C9F|nr:uncharacterized protein LOC125524253 [Triticum urartu]XP_048545288.1 uncharacterized protein LOC125524253 [Triticum urartu]XP_048545295.1 uncharacterized protein LOC125524261 [Triticum urartu]XP_048545296.1 uncharacterized protein LOC125524261 [Triticum urartu]